MRTTASERLEHVLELEGMRRKGIVSDQLAGALRSAIRAGRDVYVYFSGKRPAVWYEEQRYMLDDSEELAALEERTR